MGWSAAGMVIGAYMSSRQQPVQAPHLPPPPAPPQAAKMPSAAGLYGAMSGTGQSGGQKGVGQTSLAGTSGVDPNALTLNKPTLLGE